MSANEHICGSAKIAAFIDGELDAVEHAAVGEHIERCSRCSNDLRQQRQFMCELDSAMAGPLDMPVPRNFAEVVAVRAESDMRGLRQSSEHRKVLLFCTMLAISAFSLLGSRSESVVRNARTLINQVFEIFELIGKAVYDAISGFTVILRVLTRGLFPESRTAEITALVLFVLALGLLSCLIARYHRTRLTE
jgi:predicted anti-sigma-YlaC factor YlaD